MYITLIEKGIAISKSGTTVYSLLQALAHKSRLRTKGTWRGQAPSAWRATTSARAGESACLASRRQSGWMVGIEMFETHAGCSAGPSLQRWRLRWASKNSSGGNRNRSFYLHPTAALNLSFRHQCVRNQNSASECADCLPRAGDLREIQVWGRICIKHRRREASTRPLQDRP